MSQAAAPSLPKVHGAEQTPSLGVSWGKLMMWLFLCSDGMSFAGLIVAYAFFRHLDPAWPSPEGELGSFAIYLATTMTFILICSSLTMVKALSASQKGDTKGLGFWLGLTVLGGLTFLGCQIYEWTTLLVGGYAASRHLFDATFFIMTGFHGCHVLGGVIYLSILWLRAKTSRPPQPATIEIAGLYWHFVDLVWILIFTFVYLVEPRHIFG